MKKCVNMEGIYREHILEHARHPRNRGVLVGATHEAREANPQCGDVCEFRLRLVEGNVAEAMFNGHSCALSTASASLLTELLMGSAVSRAQAMNEDEFLAKLGIAVTSGRLDCALLPLRAFKKILIK